MDVDWCGDFKDFGGEDVAVGGDDLEVGFEFGYLREKCGVVADCFGLEYWNVVFECECFYWWGRENSFTADFFVGLSDSSYDLKIFVFDEGGEYGGGVFWCAVEDDFFHLKLVCS